MRYAIIRDNRGDTSVRLCCRMLGVSPSGFYRWVREPVGRLARRTEALLVRVRGAHEASGATYGSPRVQRVLALEGQSPCRNTVAKLMKGHGIRALRRLGFRPRTTDSRPASAPNLLNGRFEAQEPNQVWTADITYIPTAEGYLYLAAEMDLFSRKIVGWSMGTRLTQQLVIDALRMAIGQRSPPRGLIHHSDRGSQYTARAFVRVLTCHGIPQSMSGRGNCYDNAPTESLWSTIKRELVYPQRFSTRAQAQAAIFRYMAVFYNQHRLHSALEFMSPDQFEARYRG